MKHSERWIRATSNLMLGIALGLLAYSALTSLVGRAAQRELRAQTPEVVVFSVDEPEAVLAAADAADAGPVLDWAGWEQEDAAYWGALAAGDAFGRIVIPRMDLDVLVVNGVQPADLRRGPGWIDWSNLPGPTGTCGISGHRTTYGAPFRRIDQLVAGDTIDLFSPYRRYRYRVTRTLIVRPNQVEVVAPTEQPSLTLTACHPLYSAQYRIAVQADLVDVRRIEDSPE